jgi:hypothetical protein
MEESTHILLIKDGKVNPSFIRANSYLLKKYKDRFNSNIDYDQKLSLLCGIWQEEFSAKLILNGTTPTILEFPSDSQKFLFLLNYGS